MESWWTQSLSGIFKIRSCWWDTASFNWSEPRSGNTKLFEQHGKTTSIITLLESEDNK
jgi:hypothetical protein